MRLTDWCLLSLLLLICMLVPRGFESISLQQNKFTTEEYNRIVDRAAEDCLMDTVKAEEEDGTIQIDTKAAETHFYEQLEFVFDVSDQASRDALWEGVRLLQFVNQNNSLSMEETDALRSVMEHKVNQTRYKDAELFSLFFPYIQGEEWYQNIKQHSIFVFYDVEEPGWSQGYNRYLFSGSMIQKKNGD